MATGTASFDNLCGRHMCMCVCACSQSPRNLVRSRYLQGSFSSDWCRRQPVTFTRTLQITVRDGDANDGNAGCNPPDALLPGHTYIIRVEMRNDLLVVFVDDIVVCSTPRSERSAFVGAVVYASDPW